MRNGRRRKEVNPSKWQVDSRLPRAGEKGSGLRGGAPAGELSPASGEGESHTALWPHRVPELHALNGGLSGHVEQLSIKASRMRVSMAE